MNFARFQTAAPSFLGPLTPMVRRLLWANGIVFLAEAIIFASSPDHRWYALSVHLLGLTPARVLGEGWVWQLATYMFLHEVTSLWHLFWNMFMLWMFGGEIERLWGGRAFLRYYFITGIGAGLTVLAVTPAAMVPTIGASGALFGLLLAYGMTFPNRLVYIYFLFPIRVKWLVVLAGFVSLYSILTAPGGGISHLAHLGGLVFGWLYLKRAWRIRQLIAELRWNWRRRSIRIYRDDEPPPSRGPWVH